MTTIAQNKELLKQWVGLLEGYRPIFKQERTYARGVALVVAEVLVFARHTVTQLLLSLGLNGADWSAWYRLFSAGRFGYDAASAVLFGQTLEQGSAEGVYVVAGDATQTPRSSRWMEGVGWLRHPRTAVFRRGLHRAQRWFHGSHLLPAEQGYSRAIPLRWLPAFTPTAQAVAHRPCREWEAALAFIRWVRAQLTARGLLDWLVLMVGDGQYDTLGLWRALPPGVVLLARSAKNRVLHALPPAPSGRGRPRRYGPRAPTPQQVWQARRGWRTLDLLVRGRVRHLQVKVAGPFLRPGAPDCPLMLVVVRGKDNAQTRRDPLPFRVNATPNAAGQWALPLPLATLLFWAWQRWEVEVTHRELKTTFGLGHKQCWNPRAAVASVQWSAWVYALLVLAGYRTWGLCHGPTVPTRWWRGAPRWSFPTLWRAYRAALWGDHHFRALYPFSPSNWPENEALLQALRNAAFAAAPT